MRFTHHIIPSSFPPLLFYESYIPSAIFLTDGHRGSDGGGDEMKFSALIFTHLCLEWLRDVHDVWGRDGMLEVGGESCFLAWAARRIHNMCLYDEHGGGWLVSMS